MSEDAEQLADSRECLVCQRPCGAKHYCRICEGLLGRKRKGRKSDMAARRDALYEQWNKDLQAFICKYTGIALTHNGGARNAEWDPRHAGLPVPGDGAEELVAPRPHHGERAGGRRPGSRREAEPKSGDGDVVGQVPSFTRVRFTVRPTGTVTSSGENEKSRATTRTSVAPGLGGGAPSRP